MAQGDDRNWLRDQLTDWQVWAGLLILTVLAPPVFGPILLLLLIVLAVWGVIAGCVRVLEAIGEGVHGAIRWTMRTAENWWWERKQRAWEAANPVQPYQPPTAADRIAAARAKYEQSMQLLAAANLAENELEAARLRAKQKYLKDLDGIL